MDTWKRRAEEFETQMEFHVDQVEPTHDLSSLLMAHQSSSCLQQLTTWISSVSIKNLPHRSGHATTSNNSWTDVRPVPFIVCFSQRQLFCESTNTYPATVTVTEMQGAGHVAILTYEILAEWNIAYIANVVYEW